MKCSRDLAEHTHTHIGLLGISCWKVNGIPTKGSGRHPNGNSSRTWVASHWQLHSEMGGTPWTNPYGYVSKEVDGISPNDIPTETSQERELHLHRGLERNCMTFHIEAPGGSERHPHRCSLRNRVASHRQLHKGMCDTQWANLMNIVEVCNEVRDISTGTP